MHDFNRDFQAKSGHFTQLIWKDSKEVGFGLAKSKKGNLFVVAQYYPAGNVAKQFKKNVEKAVKNRRITPREEDYEDEEYDESSDYEDDSEAAEDELADKDRKDADKDRKQSEHDRKNAENEKRKSKKDKKKDSVDKEEIDDDEKEALED